jgi:hypothetical protein
MRDDVTAEPADERAERALRESFERDLSWSAASIDPGAVRSRVRRRNRLRVVGAAAAVAVVAGGAATGTGLGHRDASPTVGPTHSAPDPAPVSLPVQNWRWDYYRDVRIHVPDAWAYDTEPSSDWCIDNGRWLPKHPYVYLETDHVVRSIGCLSTNGEPGLSGGPPTRLWATHVTLAALGAEDHADVSQLDGWWTVERPVGHVLVRAVGRDRALLEQIVDSAETVTDDSGGCSPHSPIQDSAFPRPTPAFDIADVHSIESITVCQYDLSDRAAAGLVGAYEMTGAAADTELQALQDAPLGGGPDSPQSCVADDRGDSAIEIRLHTGDGAQATRTMYAYYSACHGNGFDDGTGLRELTTAACQPLFHQPVSLNFGSARPFERCHPSPADD